MDFRVVKLDVGVELELSWRWEELVEVLRLFVLVSSGRQRPPSSKVFDHTVTLHKLELELEPRYPLTVNARVGP